MHAYVKMILFNQQTQPALSIQHQTIKRGGTLRRNKRSKGKQKNLRAKAKGTTLSEANRNFLRRLGYKLRKK